MKKILAVLMLMPVLILAGCSGNRVNGSSTTTSESSSEKPATSVETPAPAATTPASDDTIEKGPKPVVTMTMADGAVIKIELYPTVAPNTVNNFISLVNKKFYDGLTFHRVISGFMIQGGDPEGTGAGGPGYCIKGEFSSNGFNNPLKHTAGVLSMARTDQPDTAGSQFFIMQGDKPQLDGEYAAFGKVSSGMDEVNKIAAVQTGGENKPLTPIVIKKITVELNGYAFKEPQTIK